MEYKGSKDENKWEEYERKKIMREAIKKLKEIDDEKERKKIISKSIKKLKESKDYEKVNIARTFAWYYANFDNMGEIIYPEIPIEIDKYCSNYFCNYLENFIDTAKIIITGVIKALGNDETIDPFCEDLIFTHFYTPEEIKRNKKWKNFEEDELVSTVDFL